jgi:nicotinamidase-related amidase
MTSLPMRDPKTDNLLTPLNSTFIFIDIQPIQVSSVASMDRRALVENITNVAKTAMMFRAPVILSTVNAKTGQPSIKQLVDVLGNVPVYDRTTLNAWEDKEFLDAVKATGRKKLIFTALWTEVCLAYPVLDAIRDGYEAYMVVDACGGTTLESHRAGLVRMQQAGARPVSWSSLLCEMQRDWGRTETVPKFAEVLFTAEGH